jgi:hypothetical protein
MKAKITRHVDYPGEFVIIEDGGVEATSPDFDSLAEILRDAAKHGISVAEFLYWESCEAEREAEQYAEFGMSWVCGGGRAEDVSLAWAQFGRDL